jgi:tetratricopeptide (TPR) repeat protein
VLLLGLGAWKVYSALWAPEARIGYLIGNALQAAENLKFDECEALARRALELSPEDPQVNLVLGKSLLMQEKYEEAELVLRRAHELKKKQEPLFALIDLGVCLDRWATDMESGSGELDAESRQKVERLRSEARELLHRVSYTTTDELTQALGLFNYGAFLKERGEYEKAARAYETCYSILTDYSDRKDKSYQEFKGRFDFETRRLLREGMKGSREQAAQCWFILADRENSQEYYQKALEWYLKCYEANPDHVDTLIGIARSKIALGDYESAEIYCRRALSLNPEYSFGWLWLAHSLHFQGRNEEALQALKNGRRHTTDESLLARMDALEAEILSK